MLTSQLLGRFLDRLLSPLEPPALPAKTSPAAGSGKQTAGGKNDHGSPVTREAIAEQLDAMDVTPP